MDYRVDQFTNLPQAFYAIASDKPDLVPYSQAVTENGEKMWRSRSYSEVQERVNRIASYLSSIGVQKGFRAAIISNSRPEWMEADLAILALGGVVVSVYQSLPAEEIGYILFDSDSRIVFAENQEQADKLKYLASNPCHIPATEEREKSSRQLSFERIITFEKTDSAGEVISLAEILDRTKGAKPSGIDSIKPDDTAALVYTSGTTGPPKGVVQTHANHLANVRQASNLALLKDDSSIMLFLPLAHSFAKLMGYVGFLTPVELKFGAVCDMRSSSIDPESITEDISSANATIIPIVPRLLEKMRNGILQKAGAGGIGGKILALTLWAAEENYRSLRGDGTASLPAQIAYNGTSGIREKIKEKLFGRNLSACISGGAKLAVPVAEFFDALGIEVLEGYGLTETCVATNINPLGAKKIGTVGPVLSDDIEIRIGEDGEIMFRGPNICRSYHNRETATKSAFEPDGWFHTGDLGSLDEDGYLRVEGRKKEIIVTSNGKNIAPHDIEEAIKECRLVSQVVLIGDGHPHCTALITLNEEELKDRSIQVQAAEIHEDPAIHQEIWSFVEMVNEKLAKYEKVRAIKILPEDFTVDNGYLTPTFKTKRGVIEKDFKSEIDKMYQTG